MKQSMLWIPECEERRTDLWARLTEESRADLVGNWCGSWSSRL